MERRVKAADLIGAAAVAAPLLLIFWFLLRRRRPLFWFACALLAVGLGYLVATGAAGDIGRRVAPGWATKIG